MARKKTPPEYGESPCMRCVSAIVAMITDYRWREQSFRGGEKRTGPIIVACQWNYKRNNVSDISSTSFVTVIYSLVPFKAVCIFRRGGAKDRTRHTKSSPIGPAEQEEGGSLHEIYRSAFDSLITSILKPAQSYLNEMRPRPRGEEPHQYDRLVAVE